MRYLIASTALAAFICVGCTPKTDPGTETSGGGTPGVEAPDTGTPEVPTPEVPGGGGEAVAATEVEIGCAMCIYKKEGCDKCTPAVKLGDKVLLLTGPVPGGEHAFCSAAKKATVEGTVEGDKLVATKVTLAP